MEVRVPLKNLQNGDVFRPEKSLLRYRVMGQSGRMVLFRLAAKATGRPNAQLHEDTVVWVWVGDEPEGGRQ